MSAHWNTNNIPSQQGKLFIVTGLFKKKVGQTPKVFRVQLN